MVDDIVNLFCKKFESSDMNLSKIIDDEMEKKNNTSYANTLANTWTGNLLGTFLQRPKIRRMYKNRKDCEWRTTSLYTEWKMENVTKFTFMVLQMTSKYLLNLITYEDLETLMTNSSQDHSGFWFKAPTKIVKLCHEL